MKEVPKALWSGSPGCNMAAAYVIIKVRHCSRHEGLERASAPKGLGTTKASVLLDD